MTEHLPVTRYQPSNYVMCQLLPLTTVERRRRQQTKKLDTNGNVIVTRPATIRRRIIFKTAVLVYKCLHGMSPPYLSTYCKPTSSHGGRRHRALLSPANSLFHVRGQTTETAVLPFMDQSCGTVFQPNSVCWTFHCLCSGND